MGTFSDSALPVTWSAVLQQQVHVAVASFDDWLRVLHRYWYLKKGAWGMR